MNGEMAQLCDIAIASKIALKTKNKFLIHPANMKTK